MLILLPPSEGKAPPQRRGRPVELAGLSCPELTPTRRLVLEELRRVSASPEVGAVLGVGPGLAEEVRRNVGLDTLPAAPALAVYTGVLYAALDFPGLSAGARRRAGRSLRVQSALWGLVGPADRIAPYRLSMATSLPGLGPLAALWRTVLDGPMTALAGDGVVVDCRSAVYAAAWTPRAEQARRLVAVRVLTEVAGRRTVVSHRAKHTRGRVARLLLEWPGPLRSVPQVVAAVATGYRCELADQGRRGFVLEVLD